MRLAISATRPSCADGVSAVRHAYCEVGVEAVQSLIQPRPEYIKDVAGRKEVNKATRDLLVECTPVWACAPTNNSMYPMGHTELKGHAQKA